MTRSDRTLLKKIEAYLKAGKKVFVGDADFRDHPGLPNEAIIVSDERLTGRLKEDGYISFEDRPWSFPKKTSETHTRHPSAYVVKRLTEQWAKEGRDYDRHVIAIAALLIGIIGAALTIFRDFWR